MMDSAELAAVLTAYNIILCICVVIYCIYKTRDLTKKFDMLMMILRKKNIITDREIKNYDLDVKKKNGFLKTIRDYLIIDNGDIYDDIWDANYEEKDEEKPVVEKKKDINVSYDFWPVEPNYVDYSQYHFSGAYYQPKDTKVNEVDLVQRRMFYYPQEMIDYVAASNNKMIFDKRASRSYAVANFDIDSYGELLIYYDGDNMPKVFESNMYGVML